MTEWNHVQCPVIIDLIFITSDEDDHSLSSVDSYYNSFKLGIDEPGNLFVRGKVITIDVDDDETTSTATATAFDSISETESSYCSTLCLSDDSWYREKAICP
jgi:hypothetical protein